jgi:transitional endoplasmic reticulum ATPase
LNDLRRKQSSIFIVATNRLRSFDTAVVRPGRFDMLLFVGTPNLSSRLKRLASKLESAGLAEPVRRTAVGVVEEYLEANWETMRFLTFTENEALLNTVVDVSVR